MLLREEEFIYLEDLVPERWRLILHICFFAHVRVRFIAWKDPWSVIEGSGYQVTQSLFAIAAGGWLGKGLTQGRPNDIPVVESDFIFSAITEEFGVEMINIL